MKRRSWHQSQTTYLCKTSEQRCHEGKYHTTC